MGAGRRERADGSGPTGAGQRERADGSRSIRVGRRERADGSGRDLCGPWIEEAIRENNARDRRRQRTHVACVPQAKLPTTGPSTVGESLKLAVAF